MSLTSILEQHNFTGSVLLTPRKRKKSQSQDQPSTVAPSNADIFRWVLTPEAVAPCFIRDVFQMRHYQDKGEDFFWLKRVPCRSVRLLGLVVGIQVAQNKVIYTVDDGTSVIDCLYRLPSSQSPSKKAKTSDSRPPKPTFYIGQRVRTTGKINNFHETRQIVIDNIERCTSADEQPLHWKLVLSLHKSNYSSSEPFTIPAAPSYTSELDVIPQTSQLSPATSTVPSPAKSTASSQQSPRKLRHPSRLHSRDLTAITFRIYVKHYMDNYSSVADAELDNDIASCAASTPTKGPHRSNVDSERTPRPSRSISVDPSNRHLSSKSHPDPASLKLRGFTLSFLRRVPELSDMAQKVVRAETKRRARESKKAREGHKASASGSLAANREEQMELSAKMKRLWRSTIIQLAREGSIVLWNGPVYPVAAAQRTSIAGNPWRERSTSSSFDLTSSTIPEGVSLFSAAGNDSRVVEEEVVFSEPEPDEESYVSLTPQYFAIEVEKAIKVLWKCAQHASSTSSSIKGPTKQRILSYLRRDGMWEQVGEWNIEEALEVLRVQGRAWMNNHGVWDLVL